MRPDEHKKKQSRQYHKKQAAKGGKEDGTEKGKGKKSSSHAGKSDVQINIPKKEETKVPPAKLWTSKFSSDEQSSDDDERRKIFRRRTIESNWDRYEILPDKISPDISETDKVLDFKRLLNKVETADSQMRLQNEKDWDDWNDGSSTLEFLAIDCQELGQALNAVPLPVKYDIISEATKAGLLETFEEDARKPELSLQAKGIDLSNLESTNNISTADKTEIQFKPKKSPMDEQRTMNLKSEITALAKDVKTTLDLDSKKEKDDCDDESVRFWTGESKETDKEEDIETDEKVDDETIINEQDEHDLDQLLSMELPTSTSISETETQGKKATVSKEQKPETSNSETLKEPEKRNADTSVDELEDWLDSMLDD